MVNAKFHIPEPQNEPNLSYLVDSPERQALKTELSRLRKLSVKIPIIIGSEEVTTERTVKCILPHDHQHSLGEYSVAGREEVEQAIEVALEAKKAWLELEWIDRASIFLKAAKLLAGSQRAFLTAVTMLSLSKTVYQAEIDVAELIDFFRFNAYFMQQMYENQPQSTPYEFNRVEYRPLEGIVFAVAPFNFISIMANLPTAPAMLGNVVIWKPASSTVYPAYHLYQLLKDAGLPPGVINFLPGFGSQIGDPILTSPHFGGLHFTGSTGTFQYMWKKIGENIKNYRSYPRIVGETGGKDFVFAHSSASVPPLATALIRGAFQFQGQKCSAVSRAYLPDQLWPPIKTQLLNLHQDIAMGDIEDFQMFMGAVIDEPAFDRISKYILDAQQDPQTTILSGGKFDKSSGYFIEPTILKTENPQSKFMNEEIFGPILTIYVYQTDQYQETLELCNQTSPYALTGAIFATDRHAIKQASQILRYAAGNFYINDKPTGAIVGRQPFGGARGSGTNDKAGSLWNLIRWVSPRTIKETYDPPQTPKYPYMIQK